MIISENKQLKTYNTFGISAIAGRIFEIECNDDLIQLFKEFSAEDFIILGGGSNILLTKEFYKNVIYINIQGIDISERNLNSTVVKVAAGTEWDDFLKFNLNNNIYGFENLALIPGKAGAAPIQNIGAYGVEQKDYFFKLTAYLTDENKFVELSQEECQFSYRNSIFKNELKGKVIITDVYYKLLNEFQPNLDYKDLSVFKSKNIEAIELFDKVCEIRKAKLPYPDEAGNAGSFFKNPVIEYDKYISLKEEFPDINVFHFNDKFKLSAGWLIENAGYKGKKLRDNSDAMVYKNHALIIVNMGSATGSEILELSEEIIHAVNNKFGVILEREVNIV